MMKTSGEINALLNLIDDPDEEVFESITARFIGFGAEVIPYLEEHKLLSSSEELIKKTELIIRSVELALLSDSLKQWNDGEEKSLLEASLAVSSFLEREAEHEVLVFEMERLRKSIWLELNDYLTPLEEINIINRIIFDYFKLKGIEISYTDEKEFDVHQLLVNKTGNSLPLGAIYLIMGEMLGIPIKPVDIPKQNLLCYLEAEDPFAADTSETILFFVDPLNGQVYTHRDIEKYLKKIQHSPYPFTIAPSDNQGYVQKWLLEIARCAKEKQETIAYAALKKLASLLKFQ